MPNHSSHKCVVEQALELGAKLEEYEGSEHHTMYSWQGSPHSFPTQEAAALDYLARHQMRGAA